MSVTTNSQMASSAQSSSSVPEDSTQANRPEGKHAVHWFRKGLRIHDNPALRDAITDATTFRCVFILDPWFATSNVGINKWRFLLQCLEDLDDSLKKLNSRLYVIKGQPADALPKLFREWGTTALTFEEDPEPFGRVRDHNIMTKCREVGISVTPMVSHTLYKLDDIIELNDGKAPLTYHQFQAMVENMPLPPEPADTITLETLNGAMTPILDDHDERFGVPTLEELGFEIDNLKPAVWVGGEKEGLIRLDFHLDRKEWVATHGRPKMTPQSLMASRTGLSPYLRFGCLSPRLFYYKLSDLYKRLRNVRPPLSLHGQILWREFFYCAATRNPNFDRMEGNPICVQIPWEQDKQALAKWARGQTGFPWIDAIMIQLRDEGWIHHLARHAVACFLTRGDLWLSWEEGMKVFDELLLDADWSVNAGTWMWLSCSSFFQQFFQCCCPVRFGRKMDPNGEYIKKYLPVLSNLPIQYIHEPWMAPREVQDAANCVLGRDYPLPIVDHQKVAKINIARMKQVYEQLASYRPEGPINANVMESSSLQLPLPNPTSVIVNINQTNYLCNQTSNPAPATTEFKQDYVFLKPTRNSLIRKESKKQTSFKQVVIVHPPEISYFMNSIQQPVETVNYDFTKIAIHNLFPNQEEALSNVSSDGYNQHIQQDEYTTRKPKLYYIENRDIFNSDNAQNFSPRSFEYTNGNGPQENDVKITEIPEPDAANKDPTEADKSKSSDDE